MTSKKCIFLKRVVPPLMLCAIGVFCVMGNFTGKLPGYNPFQNSASSERALQTRVHRRLAYDQTTSALPAWTDKFANVWEPFDKAAGDTPIFWYSAKAGGTTIGYTFGFCMGLTLANHLISLDLVENANNITVHETGSQFGFPFRRKYVNVRTESPAALDEAASRDLIGSGLADVVMTPYISYAGSNLFVGAEKARGFAMFRHPMKRAIDQFFYRQHATFDTSSFEKELAMMDLLTYVKSNKLVENYEVRSLLEMNNVVDITPAHVEQAKEILRQKFLVGIFEWYEASVIRYEKYFGWWDELDVLNNYTINNCHFTVIGLLDHVGSYPKVPNSEEVENILKTRMWADVELYHYAKILFNEQEELLL